MSLLFKTGSERSQWAELGTKNKPLVELVIDLVGHIRDLYSKDVVLTSVYRSPEQQSDLYKQSAVKVEKSAHETYEAVDLRSWLYTPAEIAEICAYLNKKHKNANGKPVAMCHAITGGAFHFHVALYR